MFPGFAGDCAPSFNWFCIGLSKLPEEESITVVPFEIPSVSAGPEFCALTTALQQPTTTAKQSTQLRYAVKKLPISVVKIPCALTQIPPRSITDSSGNTFPTIDDGWV
jgi:hypothetical protein